MFNVGSVQGYLKLNTTGWNTSMKSAGMQLQSLSRTFTGMAAAVMGSLFLIEREFGKFDKAIRHATSVSQLTSEQFNQMSQMALDASVQWNKAATTTAEAFYYLGSAGLSAQEQLDAFNTTVMLSRAMGSELSATVEGLVDVTSAFGLTYADAAHTADILTAAIINSNEHFEDLDKALGYVGSTAAVTNNTLADTAAMLAIMANAGIRGCYDDQTEVLTRRGWIKWCDVLNEDEFATCDPNTDEIEYQKSTQLIRYHHKGKMYHVANRGIDLCVTPDHRMWVKRRDHKIYDVMRAAEVKGKAVKYKAGGLKWKGVDPPYFTLLGFNQNRGSWDKQVPNMHIDSKVWAHFIGWYISEGSCDYIKGCYRVRITQNPGEVRDKMREVLSKLPITIHEDKNGFNILNQQIWKAVQPLGKAPEKYIPEAYRNWSPRLLSVLLEALLEGDGDKCGRYYTSSKKLADHVMEIALKVGASATMVMWDKAGTISNFDKEGREIRSQYDQWSVGIKWKQLEPAFYPYEYHGVHGDRLDGSKFPVANEWVDYDGEVFCAEVPNHLLIVRRNGKPVVSGNSMAGTILRRSLANLIQPTAEMRNLLYTLGINIYDSTGQMYPFVDIMKQLETALSGTTEQYKNLVFKVLFGLRAVGGQIVLFNAGSEAVRGLSASFERTGTTAEVANKQMKAFLEQIGRLWQQVRKTAIELGELLAPSLAAIADHVRNSTVAFEGYVKANKEAITQTLKWALALSAIILIGIPLITMIGALGMQIVAVAGLLLNPWVALVTALYVVRAVWKETFQEGGELNKALDEFSEVLKNWLINSFGVLGKALVWIGQKTVEGWNEIFGLISGMGKPEVGAPELGAGFGDVVAKAGALVGEIAKTVRDQFKQDVQDLGGIVSDYLPTGLQQAYEQLRALLSLFMNPPEVEAAMAAIEDAGNQVADTIAKAAEKPRTAWQNAIRDVAHGFSSLHDALVSTFSDIQSTWASTMESFINEGGKVKDFIEGMFKDILRSFNHLAAEMAARKLFAETFGRFSGALDRIELPGEGGKIINPLAIPEGGYIPFFHNYEVPEVEGAAQKMAPVTINVSNRGTPVNLRTTGQYWNGRQFVINAVMEEYSTNPNFRDTLRG